MTSRLLLSLLTAIALAGAVEARAQTQGETARDQAHTAKALVEAAIGAPFRIKLGDQAGMRLAEAMQFAPREQADAYLRAHNRPVPEGLIGLFMYGGRQEP